MSNYRKLHIWQLSIELSNLVYYYTKSFPRSEMFGLVSQIRRCSVSIPSNIAEGYGRGTDNEIRRFCQISIGSLYELQTQLEISFNQSYLLKKDFEMLIEKSRIIEASVKSFINKLK